VRTIWEKKVCGSSGEAGWSEKRVCNGGEAVLHCRQPERGGKACWDAEQFDRHLVRGGDAPVPASRSAHERRECARCSRERITSVVGGEAAEGERLISMR
jgi:hypothetical protein